MDRQSGAGYIFKENPMMSDKPEPRSEAAASACFAKAGETQGDE
jgi:hypothetical protein